MKKTLFILLLAVSTSTFGQNQDSLTQQKFSIGFSFSPDYTYAAFNGASTGIIELFEGVYQPSFGYTSGVFFIYKINNSLAVEGGLKFASLGFESDWQTLTDQDHNEVGEMKTTVPYDYLHFPLKLNYSVNRKKIGYFVSVGLSPSLFIKTSPKHEVKLFDGTEETIILGSDLSPAYTNLFILAGIGVDYSVSEKFVIRIEPIYRRSLTPVYPDVNVDILLYSFGINFGVLYKF